MNLMKRAKLRPEHPFTLEGPCIGTAKGLEDPAKLRQMSGTPAMGAALLAAAGRREAAPSGTMGFSLRRQPHHDRTSFLAPPHPTPPYPSHPSPIQGQQAAVQPPTVLHLICSEERWRVGSGRAAGSVPVAWETSHSSPNSAATTTTALRRAARSLVACAAPRRAARFFASHPSPVQGQQAAVP
jgi:hypothetical protein